MGSKLKEKLSDDHVAMSISLFLIGAALIILYMIFKNFSTVTSALSKFAMVISPFIYGVVIAYLIAPIYDFIFAQSSKRLIPKVKKHPSRGVAAARVIATVVSMLIFIACLTGFGILVIPRIFDSIASLVDTTPKRVESLIDWISAQDQNGNNEIIRAISAWLTNSTANITEWMQDTVLPRMGGFVSSIYAGVWGTVKTVMNILIGIITSVYILNERKHFKAQFKKIMYGLLSKEHGDSMIEFAAFTNKTFGGFISGKIIDSIIIGIICFVVMVFLGLPYAVLVSVIVGVTNIIPFFGPFIGAIPGAFIICVDDPIKALVFLVMIFFLQQFDGYILGPKILGDSTGLSSFWVMFAIIIGGGLFGFLGMVLAVPTFAVFYYYFKKHIEHSLDQKGISIT